jgi:hypothetical protein
MSGPTGILMRGPGPQLPPGAVENKIVNHELKFKNPLVELTKKQHRNLAGDPLGKPKPGSALEGILDPPNPSNNENQSPKPKPKQVSNKPPMSRGTPPRMENLNIGSPPPPPPQMGNLDLGSPPQPPGILQGITNVLTGLTRSTGGKKRTKKGKKAKKNKSRKPNKLALRRSTRKHTKRQTKRHPKKNAKRQTKKH